MLSYLYNYSRMIKIPNHRCQMFYKIDKTKEILKSKLGDLSDDEVSKFTNISMKDIEEIKKLPTEFVSLDETLRDEEISKTADLISMDKETLEDTIIKKIILSEAFDLLFDDSVLGQRNRKIMLLRFGFIDGRVWQLDEIGDLLGITKERVRQIELRFLGFLRNNENLKEYKLTKNIDEENYGMFLRYIISNRNDYHY